MCDVLGFGDLVMSSSLEHVVDRYGGLLMVANQVRRRASSIFADPVENTASVRATILSDAIILTSAEVRPSRTVVDLGPISDFFEAMSSVLQASVIVGLPLRAGVAFGECYVDLRTGIFVGRPIVDAYRAEGHQEWIGGACHVSCEESPYFDRIREWSNVVPYDVPTKPARGGTVDPATRLRYAVPWCSPFRPIIEELREHVAAMRSDLGEDIPSSVLRKYDNTLTFLDYMHTIGRDAPV